MGMLTKKRFTNSNFAVGISISICDTKYPFVFATSEPVLSDHIAVLLSSITPATFSGNNIHTLLLINSHPQLEKPVVIHYLIPPRGSASPVLLSICKDVFEVVGVDLPIKVLLTSGADVIVVLFSVIVGAIGIVIFVLFNSIESDGMPSCANIG
jgi:hypothetical protein